MVNKLHSKYKILTWNILYSPNFLERLPEIARLIKNSKADIALLQEINTAYTVEAVAAFGQIGYKLHLDDKLGKKICVGIAYNPTVFTAVDQESSLDVPFRAMSLDLVPTGQGIIRRTPTYITPDGDHHRDTPLSYASNILTVISYHGHWGGLYQAERLAEVAQIDQFAGNKSNAVIIGGDFNATPNEPAISYLRGDTLHGDEGTMWVDSQILSRELSGTTPYNTSLTHGSMVEANSKLDLDWLPERRIDYLLSYGYSYGRPYGFDGRYHDPSLSRARTLSDHAPVIAGLLSLDR